MRRLFYVALVIALLAGRDTVAMTVESDKARPDETNSDFVAPIFAPESRMRFLRVNHDKDDNLTPLFAADEERTKVSGLKKVAKELKMRNQRLKKLAAAAEKMKTNPKKLTAAAKKAKVNIPKAPAKLTTMEYDKFTRFFKDKLTPEKAKRTALGMTSFTSWPKLQVSVSVKTFSFHSQ